MGGPRGDEEEEEGGVRGGCMLIVLHQVLW